MNQIRVFISSVQSEFAEERQALSEYLTSDALLGKFFEPFIFENVPAITHSAAAVYFKQVELCDIYIGLFGTQYGFEDADGISPTEREFDYAGEHHKTRLIFISNHPSGQRHPKEAALIQKAELLVVRKKFSGISDLKASVYTSLIRYLEEKEYIRTGPFDATINKLATLDDLDPDKIREFVRISKVKRGFPLPEESSIETILTHLNLTETDRISNAAILLFGKQPQRYFISSEVKCAHFHGTEIEKPIPSYQVYKGDVFQLVNQAVDYILSRIDMSVGTRDVSAQVSVESELPIAAVTEAIVNAIAHRDYTSNGSVQVMLFKDRLEIWNPGHLPYGLTTEKLRHPHSSIPTNPLLAEPMYLAGYIERMGTGTGDIIKHCLAAGLKEPKFVQDDIFKIILWRKPTIGQATDHDTDYDTDHDTDHDKMVIGDLVKKLMTAIVGEMSRTELQAKIGIAHVPHFMESYLNPALEMGIIEKTIPDKPKSKNQKYRLTAKGYDLLTRIKP